MDNHPTFETYPKREFSEQRRPAVNRPSEGGPGEIGPRERPTSVDLMLQARAMRHQWLVAALGRRSAKLARLVPELVARARLQPPAAPKRLRFSGRPAT
jgi:hypothetical protein